MHVNTLIKRRVLSLDFNWEGESEPQRL